MAQTIQGTIANIIANLSALSWAPEVLQEDVEMGAHDYRITLLLNSVKPILKMGSPRYHDWFLNVVFESKGPVSKTANIATCIMDIEHTLWGDNGSNMRQNNNCHQIELGPWQTLAQGRDGAKLQSTIRIVINDNLP